MIQIKKQLLEDALDQLNGAQKDNYVQSTQNVIDEIEVVLRHQNTKVSSKPSVDSSLNNIYEILHEFRSWNKEWELRLTENTKNADEFAALLSKRYKVERNIH